MGKECLLGLDLVPENRNTELVLALGEHHLIHPPPELQALLLISLFCAVLAAGRCQRHKKLSKSLGRCRWMKNTPPAPPAVANVGKLPGVEITGTEFTARKLLICKRLV